MKVGYLGRKPVTFGYEAARQIAGAEFQGYGTHGEVYEAVMAGEVNQGVLAVENQLAGAVEETLHAVVQPIVEGEPVKVGIVRELQVPVELYLMNLSGKPEDIALVMTHSVPMRQSKRALEALRKQRPVRLETCASTDAAAAAASVDGAVAAISSKLAPAVYGLKVIERVDDPVPGGRYENVTRFWVIERTDGVRFDPEAVRRSREVHKICLLFSLERDEPGGLARSLEVFSTAGINLAGLHVLPRRDRSWEYTFVVEFEVRPEKAEIVEAALRILGEVSSAKLLGLYPKARGEERRA